MQLGAMLSPQMQCALKILAAPVLELRDLVCQQLEGNPIWELQAAAIGGQGPVTEGVAQSWRAELLREAICLFAGKKAVCAAQIVHMLDERGLLITSPEQLAADGGWDIALVQQVLAELWQHFEGGLFALDATHSMRLQLLKLGRAGCLADQLLRHAPQELLQMRMSELRALTGLSNGELRQRLRLDLDGISFKSVSGDAAVPTLVADARVEFHSGSWRVELLKELWPELTLHAEYMDPGLYHSRTERSFVDRHYKDGLFIARALENRSRTVLRILEIVLPLQGQLLISDRVAGHPVSMGAVAKELGLAESTLSRAVAHKWLETPAGMIPLRSLFAAANTINGTSMRMGVQQALERLVLQESARTPLSDKQLAERLQGQGFQIARRTVAKYRKMLNIPAQDQRKAERARFKA